MGEEQRGGGRGAEGSHEGEPSQQRTDAADGTGAAEAGGAGGAGSAEEADRGDPAMDSVQPELRGEEQEGELAAEQTTAPGLGAQSGTGGAHDYPGRAPLDEEPDTFAGSESPQDRDEDRGER